MRKLIAILLFAVPVAAMAQTQKARPRAEPAAKRITIDDPDEIRGETPVGQGDIITVRKRPIHPSMLKVRQDFWPEMLKRASDI